MTKANITQYDSTPSNNADINDINIAENCPASNINNAIRELMAHLKNVDTGSQALTALSVAGSVTATTSLKTPLIEFTDGDNALTIADGGNVTANADLTVTGDLVSNTAGTSNFRAGVNAGNSIASGGNYNVVIGDEAGTALTTGDNNVAIGYEALATEDADGDNTAIGYQALKTLNVGNEGYNVAVGTFAGKDLTTGRKNVLIGNYTGDVLTDADNNVAVGYAALSSDTRGTRSTALGHEALITQNFTSTTNANNVAVGYQAGTNLTTGTANVFVGSSAGAGDTITGNDNTCVGQAAGHALTSGTNNLLLGHEAGRGGSPSGNVTTSNNIICLGDDNTNSFFCSDTSISSSDSRDKADITNFNIGLEWVKDLRPVTYKWDKRSWYGTEEEPYGTPDGSKKEPKVNIGFLAQEVLEIEKSNGFADSPDTMLTCNITEDGQRYGIKYERLVPILVNAIKELSTKITTLETENATQATQIADLISRVTALENA